MRRLCVLGAGMLLVTVIAGCPTTAGPNWLRPGPAQEQQARAVPFDPYPQSEPGAAMTGTRPRDYEKPVSEADRAKMLSPTNPWAKFLPWNWGRS